MTTKMSYFAKPAKRLVDSEVFKLFHAQQWTCVHCGAHNPNAAHILARSRGGDDVMANLVGLCGSGSSGCHGAFHGNAYIGDFGRRVEPHHVKASVARYIKSEAGEDTRWYLTAKLGPNGAQIFVERLEECRV